MDVNLDPLTTVVRLALINYKSGNVKIGITTNGIVIFNDSWMDRSRRTLQYWLGNGCSREFLFALRPPLEQAVIMYRDRFPLLFELAYRGLERLKTTYSCSNVSETITLAMRTLQDPINQIVQDCKQDSEQKTLWTDYDIEAVLVWLRLLNENQSKSYIADCIDLFLDGKSLELKKSLLCTKQPTL